MESFSWYGLITLNGQYLKLFKCRSPAIWTPAPTETPRNTIAVHYLIQQLVSKPIQSEQTFYLLSLKLDPSYQEPICRSLLRPRKTQLPTASVKMQMSARGLVPASAPKHRSPRLHKSTLTLLDTCENLDLCVTADGNTQRSKRQVVEQMYISQSSVGVEQS